ncbi:MULTISPECIES: hypothetical protein [Nostocales]|uniref:Uncharacterized protein n=3 Tax=Nostocales TaxID=1161 RepID=A0A0C1QTE2_9CYAN|nr:hypothetical protein [Tolypothrix bouteillei]KAF3889450.1 hypothetical protein DA73_0400031195 [Tolypothrix bouteillei VB521301]
MNLEEILKRYAAGERDFSKYSPLKWIVSNLSDVNLSGIYRHYGSFESGRINYVNFAESILNNGSFIEEGRSTKAEGRRFHLEGDSDPS